MNIQEEFAKGDTKGLYGWYKEKCEKNKYGNFVQHFTGELVDQFHKIVEENP